MTPQGLRPEPGAVRTERIAVRERKREHPSVLTEDHVDRPRVGRPANVAGMPIPPLTHQQRSLRGRMGAYAQQAKHDMLVTTAKARQVFRESFANAIRELHPELDEAEVQRRGEADRRAFYASISLKSAKMRARRARRKAALNSQRNGDS